MKPVAHAAVLALLCCASVSFAQGEGDEDYHPDDAQIRQLQQSCPLNDAGMLSLQEKLRSAVIEWNQATASDGPLSALRKLNSYFEKVRSGGAAAGKKGMYLLCVEKAVRQFVDSRREMPKVYVVNGNSAVLKRSSFASEDEIWSHGCKQAEADALDKLRTRCGERIAIQTGSECPQGAGAERTYAAQVSGECRIR